MKKSTHRRTTVALTGAGLALAYLISLELGAAPVDSRDYAVVAPSTKQPTAGLPGGVSNLPSLEQLRETVTRPLFLASRRAPRPTATPLAPETVVERGRYGLVGVILFDGRRLALIKPRGEDRVLRVTEGQRVDRWRVAKIGARRVLLSLGDLREELRLVDAASPRASIRPVPVKVPDTKEAGEPAQSPAS